jgi:protein-S-isoprenylcysteine O-methyltransferase Ste14
LFGPNRRTFLFDRRADTEISQAKLTQVAPTLVATDIKRKAVMRLTSIFVFALAVTQSACVMVGGYSSDGGWWIWPGSLISLLVVVVVVFLLLRRRR